MNPHFAQLERASSELSGLGVPFVFVGGASVSLHVDDVAASPPRMTKDVDVVVEVATYVEFARVEERLRKLDFEQPMDDDAPICRWVKGDLLLDVLPTDPSLLSFPKSEWFEEGFRKAQSFQLPSGTTIRAFGALYLMAAKIEAFIDRGDGDWMRSQDIEDLVTVLDGRKAIFEELATDERPARFVSSWLRTQDDLLDMIGAHLFGDYGRATLLLQKLNEL